jgi:hypothetical protein
MSDLIRGHIYKVVSARKGQFNGMLKCVDDTWATFEIIAGTTWAMLPENVRSRGEEVTVRQEFCTFTPVETGAA